MIDHKINIRCPYSLRENFERIGYMNKNKFITNVLQPRFWFVSNYAYVRGLSFSTLKQHQRQRIQGDRNKTYFLMWFNWEDIHVRLNAFCSFKLFEYKGKAFRQTNNKSSDHTCCVFIPLADNCTITLL
jgi:hypothetical protein